MFLYVKFAYLLKARISFIIGEILNEQKNSHQYINFFYHNLGVYIDNLKFVGLIRNYICILANFLKGWKSYSVLSVRTVSLLKPFIVRCEITHLSFPNTGLSVLLLRQRGDHSTAGSCGCDGVSGFQMCRLRDKHGMVLLLNWALKAMESIVLLLKFLNS